MIGMRVLQGALFAALTVWMAAAHPAQVLSEFGEQNYVENSSPFPWAVDIVTFGGGTSRQGSGALIAPNAILFAAHIGEAPVSLAFATFGPNYFTDFTHQVFFDEIHIDPTWDGTFGGNGYDLAIGILPAPIWDIVPVPLRRAPPPGVGTPATFVGYGPTAVDGSTEFVTDGNRRSWRNNIDSNGADVGFATHWWSVQYSDVDGVTDFEGAANPGDDGLCVLDGSLQCWALYSFDEQGEGFLSTDWSVAVYDRLAWIDSVLAANPPVTVPIPSASLWVMLIGLLLAPLVAPKALHPHQLRLR
ncbi:MAG: hypothetical protein AAFX85_19955 [Pseudomonadota bacterium]